MVDVAGEVRGFLCAEPFSDGWHVWELSVHAQAQRQGLGGALMRALIDRARNAGAGAVTLTTFTDVEFNTPFYAQLGFVRLSASELTPRLRDVLANEVAHGLPGQQRCAMRLDLIEA